MCFEFKGLSREDMGVNQLKSMVTLMLRLTSRENLDLLWFIEPCLPDSIIRDEEFCFFWDSAQEDVNESQPPPPQLTPKNNVTPKKPVQDATHASVVEDLLTIAQEYKKSDEYVMHLKNIEEYECNPDDDLKNVRRAENGYLSDGTASEISDGDDAQGDAESDCGDPNFGEVEVESDKEEDHYGDLMDSSSDKEEEEKDEPVGIEVVVSKHCSESNGPKCTKPHDNTMFEEECAEHLRKTHGTASEISDDDAAQGDAESDCGDPNFGEVEVETDKEEDHYGDLMDSSSDKEEEEKDEPVGIEVVVSKHCSESNGPKCTKPHDNTMFEEEYAEHFKEDAYEAEEMFPEDGTASEISDDDASQGDAESDCGDPNFGEVEVETDKEEDHYGDLMDSSSDKEEEEKDEPVGLEVVVSKHCSESNGSKCTKPHDNTMFEEEYAEHFKEEEAEEMFPEDGTASEISDDDAAQGDAESDCGDPNFGEVEVETDEEEKDEPVGLEVLVSKHCSESNGPKCTKPHDNTMFEEEYAEHFKEEEAEEMFPEGVTFLPMDPHNLVKGNKFVNKHAFKKSLRAYYVKHKHQVKLSDGTASEISDDDAAQGDAESNCGDPNFGEVEVETDKEEDHYGDLMDSSSDKEEEEKDEPVGIEVVVSKHCSESNGPKCTKPHDNTMFEEEYAEHFKEDAYEAEEMFPEDGTASEISDDDASQVDAESDCGDPNFGEVEVETDKEEDHYGDLMDSSSDKEEEEKDEPVGLEVVVSKHCSESNGSKCTKPHDNTMFEEEYAEHFKEEEAEEMFPEDGTASEISDDDAAQGDAESDCGDPNFGEVEVETDEEEDHYGDLMDSSSYKEEEEKDEPVGLEVLVSKHCSESNGPKCTKPHDNTMFEEEYAEHFKEEEAEEMFPEGVTFLPMDPYNLVKGNKFVNKHAFKKHLRAYYVKHKHQVKLSDGTASEISDDDAAQGDAESDCGDPNFGKVEVETDKEEDHYGDFMDSSSDKEEEEKDEHVGLEIVVSKD
ncbi:protein starmaker-like [Papaver somniferum]|uniref:protein starmaker-like n=1 Tax=Papaver somniferum TaxID=3469 RepID=UPI000E6FD2D4|nr:protein starmaker-like [Papaver somniferum]